jgi:hypothetical protein
MLLGLRIGHDQRRANDTADVIHSIQPAKNYIQVTTLCRDVAVLGYGLGRLASKELLQPFIQRGVGKQGGISAARNRFASNTWGRNSVLEADLVSAEMQ